MMANPGTGVAFDIEISECVISNSPVPKWLRQRLEDSLESKTKSLDDIETRLKEAELRRQVGLSNCIMMIIRRFFKIRIVIVD